MTFSKDQSSPSTAHTLDASPIDISPVSSFPSNRTELFEAAKILLKSGIPTSLGSVCEYAAGLICLGFAGNYGTPAQLAGASLGYTWSNIFCLGVMSSINQGFSVLAAQLYGARKYKELGILFQRNLFVLSIVLAPLLLSFYFADTILINLGLNYEVSINTGIYLRYTIPCVIGLVFFECIKFYLIAQNCFYLQPIVQSILSVVHIFWCYLFVDRWNMSITGIAISASITDVSCAVVIWAYIKFKGICAESWIPWDRSCINDWWPYLKQTMTLGGNCYVEWVSYEVSLFVVSMLNDEYALGAHGIAITLVSAFYMLPLGNNYTMQAYMGNAVGEGCVKKVKEFMTAGLGLNFVMTIMNVVIMVLCSDSIASFFTDNDRTREILKNMLLIYAVAHIADTNVGHLTGILKILGYEKDVLKWFCLCYSIIALNCEWIFGVLFDYGYQAIWVGICLGICLMFIWSLIKLRNLDWEKEAVKIQEAVPKTDYIEMEEL